MGLQRGMAAAAAIGFLVVAASVAGRFAVVYYWWPVAVPLLLWLTYLVYHTARRGRPDRLVVAGLALAAAVIAGSVASIYVEGNPYTVQPRDEELVALVEDIWQGLGLDLDEMYLEPYSYDDREDSARCRHLPEQDRWEAHRGGFGPADGGLGLEGEARSKLSGWTVERYEGTGPFPEVLLWAHRGDVAVEITLSDDAVNLEASAGPCAVPSTHRVAVSEHWRRAER